LRPVFYQLCWLRQAHVLRQTLLVLDEVRPLPVLVSGRERAEPLALNEVAHREVRSGEQQYAANGRDELERDEDCEGRHEVSPKSSGGTVPPL
jgi:hypothetical protein